MSLWQQLVTVVRALPRWIVDGPTRWVLNTHMPINWKDRAPGEDLGPCSACRKPWPCRAWSEAVDARGKELQQR